MLLDENLNECRCCEHGQSKEEPWPVIDERRYQPFSQTPYRGNAHESQDYAGDRDNLTQPLAWFVHGISYLPWSLAQKRRSARMPAKVHFRSVTGMVRHQVAFPRPSTPSARPLSSVPQPNDHPNSPWSTFHRHLGMKTTRYLHSQLLWFRLSMVSIVNALRVALGGSRLGFSMRRK